ncbi:hypothetical protein, partial [Corallococcus sp. AB038B]|uniref:hypothetical protein n=1 Tax=Corallococcus sp. AB038B TaxID=2316718 RepID=UPI001F1BE8D6
QRILSDLDIVSTIATKNQRNTAKEIIDALKIEQGSDFIQQKQTEFNYVSNKQQKRIQSLRNFIDKVQMQLKQTSYQCQIKFPFDLSSNPSIEQSTINSIYSQALS